MQYDWPIEQLWDYRPAATAPDDLAEFWHNTFAEQVDPVASFDRVESGLVAVETYDVTFGGCGGDAIRA